MFYKKDEIFFSIIIPTYNRANLIRRTIESVLNQSYNKYEIIIVDDGSTDNTEMVINNINHQKIKYFKKQNEERGAARNYGIRKAKGEYITFLDSDDILYKDYLYNAYESICNKRFPPFFHLGYEVKKTNGETVFKINNLESNEIYFLVKGNNLSCMGVFINQNIVSEYSFNEDRKLAGSEDWELWLRITAKYGIITDNRISSCIVDHSERSVAHYDEEKLVIRKRLSLKYALSDALAKQKFEKYKSKLEASCDIYISLHLALSQEWLRSLHYLRRALVNDLSLLFDIRTFVIFKKIIFKS